MNGTRAVWSNQTKLLVTLVLLFLGGYLLYRFSLVIPPLVIAVILAYVLSPVVNFLHRRLKIRRVFALLITYLVLLIAIASIIVGIIPVLGAQVSRLDLDFQRLGEEARRLLGQTYVIAGFSVDGKALVEQAIVSLQALFSPIFGGTLILVKDVLSSLAWLVFIFVISFYLIKDSDALRRWAEDLMPPSVREDFIFLREEINTLWSAFLRGQLILALVVMLIFSVVCFAIGLPFALFMAVLAGLMEFIPSVGHTIWTIVAVTLALAGGSTWLPLPNWLFAGLVVVLEMVFAQFDLNYLIPRIIGRSVQLPPLVIILGIIVGASLAGVLGVMLAAPTIASARVLVRYLYARLVDMEPFPESVAAPLPPPDPHWWHVHPRRNEPPLQEE